MSVANTVVELVIEIKMAVQIIFLERLKNNRKHVTLIPLT